MFFPDYTHPEESFITNYGPSVDMKMLTPHGIYIGTRHGAARSKTQSVNCLSLAGRLSRVNDADAGRKRWHLWQRRTDAAE